MRISRIAIPCAITFSGMLLGYLAIIATIRQHWEIATWLIIGAAFIDAIDGRTAKLLGATSEIGAQLDTLSDLITFCVAPAVLVYEFALSGWGVAGVAVSALPILCGTFRLARFQCLQTDDSEYFVGLPTPAAAGLLVSVVPVSSEVGLGNWASPLAAGVTVLTCWLMVSRIPFESDAFLAPGRILTNWRGAFFLVFVGSLFVFHGRAAFGAGCVYIAVGLTRYLGRRVRGRAQLGAAFVSTVNVRLPGQVALETTSKRAPGSW